MTANTPIDLDEELSELPTLIKSGGILPEDIIPWARSIAERVEHATIERGTAAQNNGWKVSSLTRFYGPKSDKESTDVGEGKL